MRDELTMSLCAVWKSYWMERKRRVSSVSGHTVGEVREVAFSTWVQKLWQNRSWGALAGEHKHKQRQTPWYLLRSNLIGFKGDGEAATEDAQRTGEENKWTATKRILNDWLRNFKNKGVRDKKRIYAYSWRTACYTLVFMFFWRCDEKDEDRFTFSFNL